MILEIPNNSDLIKILVPALAGLFGVFIGIIVTTISNWKLKTKETKLRILEKTFDKRIKAHEEILQISKILRTTISTDKTDNDHNLITYPAVLQDYQYFDNFRGKFYDITNENNHWLGIELLRELYFIQDYLASLDLQIKDKNDENLPKIAVIVKQDFIDLAGNLENISLKFFEEDLLNLKKITNIGWHKYETEITYKRFSDTNLHQNIDIIRKM
jgi:hypothetical protein